MAASRILLFIALFLSACCSSALAGEFRVRVLRPDGSPVPDVGVLAKPSTAILASADTIKKWSYSYTDEHGIARLTLVEDDEIEFVRIMLQGGGLFVSQGREVARRIGDRFKELRTEYDLDDFHDFQPDEIRNGATLTIRLPESVRLRVRLVNLPSISTPMIVHRAGGQRQSLFMQPPQAESNGVLVLPAKRGHRSVFFLLQDRVARRIEVTAEQSMADIDYGEVDLGTSERNAMLRIVMRYPEGMIQHGLVILAPVDGSTMLVYNVHNPNHPVSPGAVAGYDDEGDHTLLRVPEGRYIVLDGTWVSYTSSKTIVPALDRIHIGELPETAHAIIETRAGELSEYEIEIVDGDEREMITRRIE